MTEDEELTDLPDFTRSAAGESICETCGKTFYKHTTETYRIVPDFPLVLKRLCNGKFVKL